jgi:hypothetical protein
MMKTSRYALHLRSRQNQRQVARSAGLRFRVRNPSVAIVCHDIFPLFRAAADMRPPDRFSSGKRSEKSIRPTL